MKKLRYVLPLVIMAMVSACQSRPPVPEPRYVPNVILKDAEVLQVLPQRGACDSPSPMQCLIVKKGGVDDKMFGIGYNAIIGFEPKVGTAYQIKVRQEIDQNTGIPTGFWQLDEILTQQVQ